MSQIYQVQFRSAEPRDCPVTAAVMVMCVVATAFCWWNGDEGYSYFLMTPDGWGTQPWRLIAGVFTHAEMPLHIIFNLLMFWPFGARIEPRFGSFKTALLYLFLAFVSTQCEYAFTSGGIGLSGVVYGQFGFLWAQNRFNGRLAGLMDRQTTDALVFWFFLCIALTYSGSMNIGNFSHGSGAVFGALVGWIFAERKPTKRLLGIVATVALTALVCVGATVGRPYINPRAVSHSLFRDGIVAFEAKNYDEARQKWSELLDIDPSRYDAWFNLGLAYESLDRTDEAVNAFGRAYQLLSGEDKFRDAYLDVLQRAATKAALREDFAASTAYWRRIVDLSPRDAQAWASLAAVLRSAGQDAEADRANEQARRVLSGQDPLPEPAPASSGEATSLSTGEATAPKA